MQKKQSTRKALLASVLSLVLCLSMLIGTTFAWFTDSVTSSNNIIKSGSLDVTLEHRDKSTDTWVDAATGAIFNYELWEPGYTQVKQVKVANVGTLALKFQLNIIGNATAGDVNLADVIDVYVFDGSVDITRADVAAATPVGNLTSLMAETDGAAHGFLLANTSKELTIALKMQESAGNEYQGLAVADGFTVQLLATQYTEETDSFDNQYDKDAVYADAYVTDAASLKEAIADGGVIALMNDVEVDADVTLSVPAGKEVTLNLNGKTLAAETDESTKNRELFLVKGTMNVENGTITTEHVGTNMGWNAMTTVFDVTAGGVLNITDATVENIGGSDMAFAVHMNNWGEVTLNVTNSTIKSTYGAIRVFNSGYDMNNVTIKDSKIHGDRMAFWVHNYTLVDFGNDQAKTDAAAARLNFDIFNGTNTLTAGADGTRVDVVRYGFTDAIAFDKDGNVY